MSKKRVETKYPILPAILDRWSPRSFSTRVPEVEKLRSLFEAARLAPSAHNTQPNRFLIARKSTDGVYERLYPCLSEGNQRWVHSAQVLVLASVMRQRFSQERAEFVPYPHRMHDLGLAVMSLIIQATSMGLHCHPMAGFDPEMAQAELKIPEIFEPAVIIAVGYLGDPNVLHDSLLEKELGPRTRRPLREVVFEGEWGKASALFIDEHESEKGSR